MGFGLTLLLHTTSSLHQQPQWHQRRQFYSTIPKSSPLSPLFWPPSKLNQSAALWPQMWDLHPSSSMMLFIPHWYENCLGIIFDLSQRSKMSQWPQGLSRDGCITYSTGCCRRIRWGTDLKRMVFVSYSGFTWVLYKSGIFGFCSMGLVRKRRGHDI